MAREELDAFAAWAAGMSFSMTHAFDTIVLTYLHPVELARDGLLTFPVRPNAVKYPARYTHRAHVRLERLNRLYGYSKSRLIHFGIMSALDRVRR